QGANWIPADCFPGRVTHQRQVDLLQSACAAHFNLLRVWGGGVYESDEFYDLCDEYGLLVWQDFMFACALYPGDDRFLHEVKAEARGQVRRLAAHACLALWCGNNENEQALLGAFWNHPEHRDEYQRAYQHLYHQLLPQVLHEEDPERPYWPSSPSNGMNLWGEPNDFARGDAHAWDVWSHGHDFTQVWQMHPRFVSEFGYQSAPSMASLEKVLPPEALDFHGGLFGRRQRCGFGHRTLEKQMAVWFPSPRDFAETVYYTQVLQALSLKYAIEHWRRMRPECMGIVYWQLNDIWPGMSWSSLEFDGSWKLPHHELVNLFAPVLVCAGEAYGRLEIWVSNHRLENVSGDLTVRLWSWSGERLREFSLPVTVPAQNSQKCWDTPLPEIFPDPCRHERFLTLHFSGNGAELRNAYFPEPFKNTRLAEAKIKISEVREKQGSLRFQVSADQPAPYVYLTAGALAGRFADNGFLLMPGETREVVFTPVEPVDVKAFAAALRMRSIR
ncbi:MAG: glycoside hydrolase family 2 protein, partial [Candidatus Firestonebacteria bacterium]|nr:glycoside hydrolase family 2 protein [Candidatus Firestonebacteria bacterium]